MGPKVNRHLLCNRVFTLKWVEKMMHQNCWRLYLTLLNLISSSTILHLILPYSPFKLESQAKFRTIMSRQIDSLEKKNTFFLTAAEKNNNNTNNNTNQSVCLSPHNSNYHRTLWRWWPAHTGNHIVYAKGGHLRSSAGFLGISRYICPVSTPSHAAKWPRSPELLCAEPPHWCLPTLL